MFKKISFTFIGYLLFSLTFVVVTSETSHARMYDFTENNRLTLLQSARDAVDLKIELIKNAKHHVHIMTYYWDKKGYPKEFVAELTKAHDRGVDVRIITTYIPTLTMDLWSSVKKGLYAGLGKKDDPNDAVMAYMRYSPENSQGLPFNVHEKIFLVDGEMAILGGRNISDSSLRAKDLEVKLEGPIVNEVQEHFKKMFSFLVDLQIEKKCGVTFGQCYDMYNKLKFGSGKEKYFFPDQPFYPEADGGGVRARILTNEIVIQLHDKHFSDDDENIFSKLQDDIIDTVTQINFTQLRGYNYFILPTEKYKKYLEDNLAQGKSIQIITNDMKTSKSISDKGYLYGLPEMKNLVTKGLSLHQWLGEEKDGEDQLSYLHEKVMIFDNDHGIIGSHNFGVGSSTVSNEIAIEFYSKPIAQTLIDTFEKEFTDPSITKEATLAMLDQEISEHRKIIHFLHLDRIGKIIKELY